MWNMDVSIFWFADSSRFTKLNSDSYPSLTKILRAPTVVRYLRGRISCVSKGESDPLVLSCSTPFPIFYANNTPSTIHLLKVVCWLARYWSRKAETKWQRSLHWGIIPYSSTIACLQSSFVKLDHTHTVIMNLIFTEFIVIEDSFFFCMHVRRNIFEMQCFLFLWKLIFAEALAQWNQKEIFCIFPLFSFW